MSGCSLLGPANVDVAFRGAQSQGRAAAVHRSHDPFRIGDGEAPDSVLHVDPTAVGRRIQVRPGGSRECHLDHASAGLDASRRHPQEARPDASSNGLRMDGSGYPNGLAQLIFS